MNIYRWKRQKPEKKKKNSKKKKKGSERKQRIEKKPRKTQRTRESCTYDLFFPLTHPLPSAPIARTGGEYGTNSVETPVMRREELEATV